MPPARAGREWCGWERGCPHLRTPASISCLCVAQGSPQLTWEGRVCCLPTRADRCCVGVSVTGGAVIPRRLGLDPLTAIMCLRVPLLIAAVCWRTFLMRCSSSLSLSVCNQAPDLQIWVRRVPRSSKVTGQEGIWHKSSLRFHTCAVPRSSSLCSLSGAHTFVVPCGLSMVEERGAGMVGWLGQLLWLQGGLKEGTHHAHPTEHLSTAPRRQPSALPLLPCSLSGWGAEGSE